MGNSADRSRNGVRTNGTRAQRNPDELALGRVRLLEEAGFTYDRQIGAWLNIPAGRVIAFDRVATRSPEWLAAWLGLSPAHPLFMANGHDLRTVRSGSPALVLVSDNNTPSSSPKRRDSGTSASSHEFIKLTADTYGAGSARRIRTTALDDDEPVAMKP